jgi:hypothetical protein
MHAVGGTVTVGTAQVYVGCTAITGRGRYTGAITAQKKNGASGGRKVDVPLCHDKSIETLSLSLSHTHTERETEHTHPNYNTKIYFWV